MEPIEMSLDDIIKKNKTQKKPKGGAIGKRLTKPSGGIKKVINKPGKGVLKKSIQPKKPTDARLKLIQKNRQKFSDAREVIAEHTRSAIKDARELLSSRKTQKLPKSRPRPARIPRSRSAAAASLTITNDLLMEDDDPIDYVDLSLNSLRRTVKNDAYRKSTSPPRNMPRLPTFSIQNREPSPGIDPFDCYVVPTRRPVTLPPPAPLHADRGFHNSKMSAHMDAYLKNPPLQKGILRSSRNDEHDDRFERSYSGAESRSGRYSNESAGIFAKITDYKSPPRTKGYRILISNLVPSVSQSDVEELFSEIGDLISAKLIKIGTAEVIFLNKGDDERAHDVYHNRLIDGQPMKIALTGSISIPAPYFP